MANKPTTQVARAPFELPWHSQHYYTKVFTTPTHTQTLTWWVLEVGLLLSLLRVSLQQQRCHVAEPHVRATRWIGAWRYSPAIGIRLGIVTSTSCLARGLSHDYGTDEEGWTTKWACMPSDAHGVTNPISHCTAFSLPLLHARSCHYAGGEGMLSVAVPASPSIIVLYAMQCPRQPGAFGHQ